MAGNLSNVAEKLILEHSVGKTAWTMPTIHVGLFTTLPSDSSIAPYTGEVSGGSYARVVTSASTWDTASPSATVTTISNATAITFTQATANWGTIVGVGLFSASTAGDLIWWGPLTATKVVGTGETFQFGISALTLSLD